MLIFDRILAIVVGLFLLLYLLARAAWIPITIDEASTCMNSVPRSIWAIVTFSEDPVPNNHIFNTLAIKFFEVFGGMNGLVARLPNLLFGGLLYYVSVIQIATRISQSRWLRYTIVLLLLFNPFMIEFFALARGYGMATGLMMVAIWMAIAYLQGSKITHLYWGLLCAALAVWSNLTLLYFFVPFIGLLLGFIVWNDTEKTSKRKSLLWVIGTAILTGLVNYLPIEAIRSTDQLVFWGKNGFWTETLLPLLSSSLMVKDLDAAREPLLHSFATYACIIVCIPLFCLLIDWLQKKRIERAHLFVIGIFWGVLLTNHLMYWLADTPFLNARTSIFFFPLAMLQGVFALIWINQRSKWLAIIASLAFLTPLLFNMQQGVNVTRSAEWYFDEHTFEVLDAIQKLHGEEQKSQPYTFDLNGYMVNSFVFHLRHSNWPDYSKSVRSLGWHPDRPPSMESELYLTTTADEIEAIRSTYEVAIDLDPKGNLKVWRKK